MAASFVQLPADSTGKMLAHDTWVQGANTVYGQNIVPYDTSGNALASATAILAGTERGLVTRSITQGADEPQTTGTITTATSTVTTGSLPHANVISVGISGTYAGVNVTFEMSFDNSTWFPVQGTREDSGIVENTSGVLVANTARAWAFAFPGFQFFRVRATAWTSGTANVVVQPGTFADPPNISAIIGTPPRTALVLATASAGVTPAATEALITMAQCQRNYVALSSGTSFALTTGKTFRVQAMTIAVRASTTTALSASAFLRYNPTGAATATSAIIAAVHASTPGAVAAEGGSMGVSFPDGKDLPAGTTPGQVGVSALGSTATGTIVVTVEGYEYG